ncbi:hypothetical protein RB195_021583 [Necator americanus]|uniref:Neurotransmitter-gated ion-channel transmembrane domain-containing protein n=1 Tax=Necator americanus TaxID=51031 RepID=A0ABR1EBQ8_NECAM
MSLSFSPFEALKKIASWGYGEEKVLLNATSNLFLRHYATNEEWALQEVRIDQDHYDHEGFVVSEAKYIVSISRKPFYYLISLVAPTYIICMLSVAGLFARFSTKHERQERFTLGVTAILSMAVLSLVVTEKVPHSSEGVPLLIVYFHFNIIMVTLATILTSTVMRVHSKAFSHRISPPPSWLLRYLFIHGTDFTSIPNGASISVERQVTAEKWGAVNRFMMTGRAGFLFLSALFALSMIEVFVKAHSEDDHDAEEFRKEFGDEPQHTFSKGTEEDHIELREGSQFNTMKPKILSGRKLPTLRFLYCISCGYKQAFEQFSMAVRDKYPEMPVEGSNYPPVKWKEYLAQTINILKIAAIAVVITGRNPFTSLGMGEPAVLQWAQSNKISACMMLFLLTNMVESTLLSTGAFEIFLDKEQIWSKLESGRVPSPQELIQMIDSQLELSGKGPGGGAAFGDFNH